MLFLAELCIFFLLVGKLFQGNMCCELVQSFKQIMAEHWIIEGIPTKKW